MAKYTEAQIDGFITTVDAEIEALRNRRRALEELKALNENKIVDYETDIAGKESEYDGLST